LILAIGIQAKPAWNELEGYTYENYLEEFGKYYTMEELENRRAIFNVNLVGIKRHNQDSTKSWKKGINKFTDMTRDEFKSTLGYRAELANLPSPFRTEYTGPLKNVRDLPASVDWRQKGVVSSVNDQAQCGSCWSFATTETLESFWALSTGTLTKLSEQQILDCTPNPQHCGGTGGCEGGTCEIAFDQIIKQGGLASGKTYPYDSGNGEDFKCRFDPKKTPPVAKVSGYVDLPSNQYDPVMNAVATLGPLAIVVDASDWSMYDGGIFDDCNQASPDLDHGVQLVGYGTSNDQDYWLVRNSWGQGWGESGYIRLKRSAKVECGTDTRPSDGTGCDGGPSKVTVCGECGILYDVTYPIVNNSTL